MNVCPVCGYPGLYEPAYNQYGYGSHEICPCCGTQFGWDDDTRTIAARPAQHAILRAKWMAEGGKWRNDALKPPPGGWSQQKPPSWSAQKQLAEAGLVLQDIDEAKRDRERLLQQMTPQEAEHDRWIRWYMDKLENHSTRAPETPEPSYRCPCCGSKTLCSRGHYDICQVCGWQDDGQDEEDAASARGGPNGFVSLLQARENYKQFGASLLGWVGQVRPPRPEEM